jgi:hypothetical protein
MNPCVMLDLYRCPMKAGRAAHGKFDGAAVGQGFGCESDSSKSRTKKSARSWTGRGTTVSTDCGTAGTKHGTTREPCAGAGFGAFGSVVPYFEVRAPLLAENICAPVWGAFFFTDRVFFPSFFTYLIQRNQWNQKKENPVAARVLAWFRYVVPLLCYGTSGGAPIPRRQTSSRHAPVKIFFLPKGSAAHLAMCRPRSGRPGVTGDLPPHSISIKVSVALLRDGFLPR